MLSEYRRESVSNAHSDFYCFLYSRSRIKPLSKYFSAKTEGSSTNTAECLKDMLFKRNKTATLSNKDVDNKRYFYSSVKEKEMAEEEKIMSWLTSCEDDSNDKPIKLDNTCDEKTRSNPREADDRKNGNLQDNHFADNTVDGQNIQMENKLSDKLDNIVNSSNSKEPIISCLIDTQDTLKKIKPELPLESTELNDSESVKISKDRAPELCKKKSPPKKSGQRKISDFFQRIS